MDKLDLGSTSLGVIGYGEVGKIFAGALNKGGAGEVSVWDINFDDPARVEAEHAHADRAGVRACASMADLMGRSELAFSAVTASQTLVAARQAAAHVRPGAAFVDLNSASPHTKMQCAALVEQAGGRYLEVAIMSSVPPYGLRVPMLLGGPRAAELAPTLQAWELDAKPASDRLGVVSAIKMCRSVIVKGLEAIMVESFTAARAYGVEDAVLASLHDTLPGFDLEHQGSYFFERVIQHGKRRSEEMREAAATMAEAGVEAYMAAAAAERQGWMAALAREGAFRAQAEGWRQRADQALAALSGRVTGSDTGSG